MKSIGKKLAFATLAAGLTLPAAALAADDVQTKLDALQKEITDLKAQVKKTDDKSMEKWLTIGGDYRFKYDYLRGKVAPYMDGMTIIGGTAMAGLNAGDLMAFMGGNMTNAAAFGPIMQAASNPKERTVKNESLYSNRFGLNLKAKATQDVTVNARFLMYKIAGAQDDAALRTGNTAYSFDRAGLFDGTLGHVPGDSKLAVDQVYATWSNIADQPVWFSIGRRPSTGGVPTNLKQNKERPGQSGVPGLMVDYAFDGVTLGWAPDIDGLDGAYTKLCYGRGFQTSLEYDDAEDLHNTDMIGFNVVPYDTDKLRVELQYNRAMNVFSNPIMLSGPYQQTFSSVQTNVGDIDWFGLDFMGKAGAVNWFISGAMDYTHPNDHTLQFEGFGDTGIGLLYNNGQKDTTNGWALFMGGRYDIAKTGTKIGLEYNHGSKNWITFTPASDDMWTAKLGTRGDVYETYVIQELPLKPISSYLSKAYFKLGYQYYDFEYTGSNSWLGAPTEIDKTANSMQLTAPLKSAQNIYGTFEVKF